MSYEDYSTEFRESINAINTDETFLWLLTLSHPTLTTPIRVVNNRTDVNSRGIIFTAYPFSLTLPVDDGQQLPRFEIQLDNVGLELIEIIRGVVGPISVTMELVLASQPSTVELTVSGLQIREANYDVITINAQVMLEDIMNARYPADLITPVNYEGLFK